MVGIIGVVFFFLGILLMVIAGIWGLALAFREHVLWGLLYLLIPLIGAVIFVAKKWKKAIVRSSVFLFLAGAISTVGGFVVSDIAQNSRIADQVQDDTGIEDPLQPFDESSEAEVSQDLPTPTPEPELPPESASQTPALPSEAEVEAEIAPESTPDSIESLTQADADLDEYHQIMMVGYSAYRQGDYQTALINFRRALDMKPGDELATQAIQNTEAAIAAN